MDLAGPDPELAETNHARPRPVAEPGAVTPAPAGAPAATAPPAPEERPYEPMVRGESAYDRVTSMLMSVVVGAALIVGFLWLIYATQNAYAQRVPSQIEIVEVSGGGGGDPEGEIGGSESVDVPGAEAGAQASNATEEDAANFDEPSVAATDGAMLDPFGAAPDDGQEGVEMSPETSRGTAVASGRRASKAGNGKRGFGPGGPGDGGVSREQRWVIVYAPGQSEDEYARQLDAMKVELAARNSGTTLIYASNFTGKPITRTGLARAESRWYNIFQSAARKLYDAKLMQKAGAKVSDNDFILQYFPESVVNTLAQLEFNYKGRQPAEIRQTRFQIVPSGGSYTFKVIQQELLK